MKNLNRSRMLAARLFAVALLVAKISSALAAVHYVDLNSTNATPPYTNWTTAATNIQDAVDAAHAGDEIVVTNGIYATGGRAVYGTMTNRVAVDKPLSLRSVNGPQFTTIQGKSAPGGNGDGAIRCIYLTNGASLSGFTLTGGATRAVNEYTTNSQSSGGGLWCESTDEVPVSNCVVRGNSAYDSGGGAYRGTLNNCTLSGNGAYNVYSAGGGAVGCLLNHCVVTGNGADYGGGGAGCTFNYCTLNDNAVLFFGGGAYESTLNNCTLTHNAAQDTGGGACNCSLDNCVLTRNAAVIADGAAYSLLDSCTLTDNGRALNNCTLRSCIVYFNNENHDGSSTLNNCCTTPRPADGFNNITSEPRFVDRAGGNLRLQSNSPCINAGGYSGNSVTDADGRPRFVGVTADIGAYEFQPGVSGVFIGWLQRYGLPTDASADTADSDGDGVSNYHEWLAGTVPTDAASALRLLNPTSDSSGITVTWQSVSNRTYFLERAVNFGPTPPFSLLTSNLVGQKGTTSYTDTNSVGAGPFFYRVGVQP